jgi:hypothetical protein
VMPFGIVGLSEISYILADIEPSTFLMLFTAMSNC